MCRYYRYKMTMSSKCDVTEERRSEEEEEEEESSEDASWDNLTH